MDDNSLLECPICCVNFAEERKPMLLCISQHAACKVCVELLFKGKDKDTVTIDCHTCRKQVHYKNITPFYWLNDLIQAKKDLKKQGSLIRRINGTLTEDNSKLSQQLKKEKEKVEWLMEMQAKQRQRSNINEEKISHMISNTLENILKKITDERTASEAATIAKMETIYLKSQEMLKKQIQQKANEQLINLNEARIDAKTFSDHVKKKLQSLENQNKNLKKQVLDLKKIFAEYTQKSVKQLDGISKQVKALEIRSKKEEKAQKQVPANNNSNNAKESNKKQENANTSTQNTGAMPSPFIKKAAEPVKVEPAKLKVPLPALKAEEGKKKAQDKDLHNEKIGKVQSRNEKLLTQPNANEMRFYQPPSRDDHLKKLRQTLGACDMKLKKPSDVLGNYRSNKENMGNQTARNMINDDHDFGLIRHRKQSMYQLNHSLSQKQLDGSLLQKEKTFQTQKCEKIVAKLKANYLRACRLPDLKLIEFVDEHIHLSEKQIMKNFESAKNL